MQINHNEKEEWQTKFINFPLDPEQEAALKAAVWLRLEPALIKINRRRRWRKIIKKIIVVALPVVIIPGVVWLFSNRTGSSIEPVQFALPQTNHPTQKKLPAKRPNKINKPKNVPVKKDSTLPSAPGTTIVPAQVTMPVVDSLEVRATPPAAPPPRKREIVSMGDILFQQRQADSLKAAREKLNDRPPA